MSPYIVQKFASHLTGQVDLGFVGTKAYPVWLGVGGFFKKKNT